jgi:hypothetical protein
VPLSTVLRESWRYRRPMSALACRRWLAQRVSSWGIPVVAVADALPLSRNSQQTWTDLQRSSDGGPYACPCCRSVTLPERGAFEMCPVCFWEDDGQDDHDADEVRGGPNGMLSLTQARAKFSAAGASDPAFLAATTTARAA